MAVIAIISLTASEPVDDTIQKLSKALETVKLPAHFVVGTKVQDSNIIQVTSEWVDVKSPSDLEASTAFTSFKNTLSSINDSSALLDTNLATLDQSPFVGSVAPIIEYVKSDFPTSAVTPAFQAQIEADFAKFEKLYRKRGDAKSTGEVFLALGWSQEHSPVQEEGKEENVTSFFVMRGWQSMVDFESAVQSEVFKEAIPILMGWGAPFNLVSLGAVHGEGLS